MKKIFIYAGSALLITGCFFPFIKAPGETYGLFDPMPVNIPDVPPNMLVYVGISFITIAAISLILTMISKTKLLWLGGIGSGAILTAMYFGMDAKLTEMHSEANKQLDGLFGGMFKGVADTIFQSVELGGAGWYVTGSGALLLAISFLFSSNK